MSTSVYSLVLHILLLSALLSIPIYSGGASSGSSGGYFVYLSNEVPAVSAGRPQRAAMARAENAAEPEGKSTALVEEHAQSNAPQVDKDEASITKQEGRGPEVVEAPVMQELLPASSSEGTDKGPVPEENVVKQEAAEKQKIAQPAFQKKAEEIEKADLSEKTLLAVRNVPDENTAFGSDQLNRSEKKPDIAAEKPLTAMDDKTVMTTARQKDERNELPREEMPVPAIKQKETEKEVKTHAILSPAGLGLNERGDLQQKVVPKTVQAEPVSPETRKEVTAPSSMKETVSSEMTLPATEEIAASQVSEKVETTNAPALQAKNAEKNNDPKADLAMAKQVAESAGKIVPPKSVTIPGESTVKKEIKAGDAEERLPGKDHFLVNGNEKPPVRDIDQSVDGTQKFLPEVFSGREKAPEHKKNAGGDKTVVSAPKQTIQKIDEAGGTHYDQLKLVPDAPPKSAGMGPQKPDRELQASGGENSSLMRLAGSETGKNRAALHLESKLSAQSESALAGSPAGFPLSGTEDKQPMQPAAVEGPASAGGSETMVSSDTWIRPHAVSEKTAGPESAVLADMKKEAEKSRIGMPVSEALIQKDIRIEVFTEGTDMPGILTKLFRKSHPGLRRRRDRERQEPVEGTVEKTMSKGPDKTGARHVFSVTKAEKAAYTCVLENKGEQARTVDVTFRFYEGREKERDKEYHSRELVPGGMLRFTFILPEGIFWDDEDRFSGRVEDSRTITKFDNESGLVWKEEKGH